MRPVALAIALVWLWWPGNGLAAERLQAQLVPVAARARSHAPLPVEVTFRWSGTGVLEGRLELEFWSDNRMLNRYRSLEIALASGEQRFGLLLPPLPTTYGSQVDVATRFVSSKSQIDLGTTTLFLPSTSERSMVIGICDSLGASDTQMLRIEQNLRPARFQTLIAESSPPAVNVTLARLTPDEMAGQPLSYCAYDLIVLTASGLADLRERQWRALLRWVRAGGSLCLFIQDDPNPHQREFLSALGEGQSVDGIRKIHAGLGRCVLVSKRLNAEADLNSSVWSSAVDFLWKIRVQPAEEIHTNLSYEEALKMNRRGYVQPYGPGDQTGSGRFAGGDLREGLLPHETRFIPFRALAWMLSLFVLMIGPVDYVVLGRLRRRRYTWILFPVVTAAFTVATVRMANHYLGRGDHRRALVFVDVGENGVVFRQNRFELLFAAHDRQETAHVQEGLWAPMERTVLTHDRSRHAGYPYYYRTRIHVGPDDTPPLWEGAIPEHFQVSQVIRQWQPQLIRILSLETPPTSLTTVRDTMDRAIREFSNSEQLSNTKPIGIQKFSNDVFVLHGTNVVCVERGAGLLPASLISASSTAGSNGLFSIVAQISPSGGGDFEDLAVLDESDPGQWMVVIVTQAVDDILVYRRVYHVEG